MKVNYSDWSGSDKESNPWRIADFMLDRSIDDGPTAIEIYLDRGGKRNTFMITMDEKTASEFHKQLGECLDGYLQ